MEYEERRISIYEFVEGKFRVPGPQKRNGIHPRPLFEIHSNRKTQRTNFRPPAGLGVVIPMTYQYGDEDFAVLFMSRYFDRYEEELGERPNICFTGDSNGRFDTFQAAAESIKERGGG